MIIVLTLCSTLHLSGQNSVENLGLKTVVIDPGHGGKDPGAPGKTSKTSEKHIVLSISKQLGEKIKAAYPDVKVVYTRSTDVFVELKERVNIAKRNKADLFISIHCNSNNSSQPYGASVHILGPKSNNKKNQRDYFAASQSVAQRENSVMLLEDDYKTSYQDFNPESAESVISNSLLWSANYGSSLMFAAELDGAFRKPPFRESGYTGIHQDIFYLLWATNMPSVLLELGFISNTADYNYLSSVSGQEKVAQRLFDAFKVYKTNFDASMNVTSAPLEVTETVSNPQLMNEKPSATVSDTHYGVQIMGLGRKLSAKDPALKGLSVEIVPPADGGKIYKYVAAWSESLEGAKSQLSSIRKKFPDAFLVKIEGNIVSRVK
ncbi:MAG: N-acetylmuramoyl-L-alanine amidase [Bacteroidales bacterium]|nr:N-acetylmuramoyl-L-alanine amidase [Bacteroidales bacterium]